MTPFLWLSLLFLLLATSPTFGQGPSPGAVTLRVGGAGGFKLPDKNETAPRYRADRAIVEAFEHKYPYIHLESAQGLQISGPAAESSLLMQFAGGTAPDVVYVNFRQSATYVSQGFLTPLDAYIAQDPGVLGPINPLVLKVLRDVGHGKIYSLPYSQFVQALYYRKDLFQAAGLDPNRPPASWGEFYDDCKKLTNQQKGVWGFEFENDPADTAYYWINFLWQAGGDIVTRDSHGNWHAAFDSPAGVTALLFYKHLMDDPWVGEGGKTYYGVAHHSSTFAQDRANGTVAMWFAYQSNVIANMADASQINPNIVGIAPMPRGPTGITANELNAAMWGISSQIKDPRVRDAAWKFVKFMASDEADRIRTESYVEAGLGNTVNPLSLEKHGYGDFTTKASRAWLAANQTLFANGHPEPYGDNMSQIYVLLGEPLSTIELYPNDNPRLLLAHAAKEVDTKLTGYVDPRVMARRRAAALAIFILLIVGTLAVIGIRLSPSFPERGQGVVPGTPPVGTGRKARGSGGGERVTTAVHVAAWLIMAPAVLSILVWAYYPLARGLEIAFENYRLIGASHFVGLDNFIDLFYSPTFWYGVRASTLYTVYTLLFGFALPIILALALSEIPVGRILFRTVYYLPAVTAPLVIAFLWKIFLDGSPHGLLNQILSGASGGYIAPHDWLGKPKTALLSIVAQSLWGSVGPGCIIYLAALRGIPEDIYEAADLDGAGILQKIRHITLPTLRPLIVINLVGATIAAFQISDKILVMTGGGPVYSTHTLGLEIFYNSFLYLKFGYGAAAAWVMGSLLIGFTLLQLRILRRVSFSAASA
jgi:multiple sugar transport system permease protein